MSRTNETRHIVGIKLVNVNVDEMQVFVKINRDGMKTNADVHVKN